MIAAFLAFCACQRIATDQAAGDKTYDLSKLRFNLTIESGVATKGVRSDWQTGDKVFIFFQNVSSAYAYVEYDGSAWSTDPIIPSPMTTPATLGESGYLTAVYLPYGNSSTPSWDGNAWAFSGTNDYYYLKSEKAAYFITDPGNILPTLGAYLYMDTADSFIQFYLPDDSASNTIQFACNYLIPAGIAGVTIDGTVTETSGTPGSWVTARAETIAGEKGYYASGKLSPRPGNLYYFAINAGGNYKHYFKQRSSSLSGRGAYQLPDISDWLTVSASTFVEVNGCSWCTVNYGASTPWEVGTSLTASAMNSLSVNNTEVPTDNTWNLLLDRTKVTWINASILGADGFLVMDRLNPSNYFFIRSYYSAAGVNYWSATAVESVQHYMKTDNEGVHELTNTDAPANAYVRLISSLYGGGFNPPENGGDI